MGKWNPTEQPYRVTWTVSASPKLHGWGTKSKMFSTLDDAVNAANEMFGPGVTDATIDLAKNPENWLKRGCWKALGRRKRNQSVKLTKNSGTAS
jgi:hypothetical protein